MPTDFRHTPPPRIWLADQSLELSHYTARRSFPLHFHAEAIVAVVVAGAEAIWVQGSREVARAGAIVVLDPERAHVNEPLGSGGARYRGFYLDRSQWPDGDGRQLTTAVVHDPRLARTLIDLHRSLEEESSPTTVAAAKHALLRIFELAPRLPTPAAPQEVQWVAQTLRARCSERLVWKDLARPTGLSPFHLARRFTQHYGLAPHLFQTQYRIARAKRLIRQLIAPATVAVECGFSDQSHLTHQFGRYVGLPPGAFARAQNPTRP